MRYLFFLFLTCLIGGCSNMKPEDYKNTKPEIRIEEYFLGNVKAWGILQDRKGKVTRQFKAAMNGSFSGEDFILNENFNWNDGEKQERRWIIKKIGENKYEGTAPDVIGTAKGVSYGSAFKFEYNLLIPYKGKKIKVKFDDWIFKQDNEVAINRAIISKFGFKVGELTVFFSKN
jgi:hypothetical protein|tara:strand:- start:246 stop:767 length:522 start_codon:yes stop_codon:yes gene_type:complete